MNKHNVSQTEPPPCLLCGTPAAGGWRVRLQTVRAEALLEGRWDICKTCRAEVRGVGLVREEEGDE